MTVFVVVSRSYSDGTAAVSYTYDAAGRRATMVDATGTTSYGYDSANRVVSKTLPSGAVMAYTYDAANNVLTASDGSGGTATRTYDQVGRLKTVTDEAGNVTTYGYDPAGFLVSTVLPGGVRQDRVVDAAGQIGLIANSGSAGLIRSFQYTRDASGNPTAAIANGPTGVLEGQSQLFTYDNANRLRKACWTAVACKNANQTAWTYDVVGKRLTEKVGAAPAKVFTYGPQTDQLTQTVDGTQITNFVYDANGNQLQNGGTVSTFNAANQTVSVTDAAIASTYLYDGDGLRVSDTLNQFGTLTTTRFDWDTVSSGLANVVAGHRTGANGVNNNRFTYGLGLVSSEASDHVRSFSLSDPLGTITQVSSSAGAVRWSGSTGPFGELHDSVAASGDPYGSELLRYRFTGQYDAGFGLTHMRARNYNASLGAFTQTDPLAPDPDKGYPSAYVYGNNNPVIYSDPSGLRAGVAPWTGVQSIPRRDWGGFDLRLFISSGATGGWLAGSAGDKRGFSAGATCAESRACVNFDFAAGTVTAQVNYSCSEDKSECSNPSSANRVEVTDYGSTVRFRYSIVNPRAPKIGLVIGARAPAIDGTWTFKSVAGPQIGSPGQRSNQDSVEAKFEGDAYPSQELYARTSGAVPQAMIQLNQTTEKLGVPAGLTPFWPNKTASATVRKIR
jgi:RHS repeat-associated protein